MSEILQNAHSLAVTNEVVRQRSREGPTTALLHFLAPGSSSLHISYSSRACGKHTGWPWLPPNTLEEMASTNIKTFIHS